MYIIGKYIYRIDNGCVRFINSLLIILVNLRLAPVHNVYCMHTSFRNLIED